ncbi:MAG: hypothetical protein Q7S40_30610 [Opitutaceae bacterium]|nr:hypothetical protein [Opitutaceae bacterium]
MKTSSAFLLTAMLVPAAMTFASTSAQRASADTAAAAGTPLFVVEKMQRGTSLTFADIQELARHRMPDDATIAYLRSTKMSYRLTTESFDRLRAAGVSERVMNHLLLASPLEVMPSGRDYRPAPIRGYRHRSLRAAPRFGRFGGFGGQHRHIHRGGYRGGHR